MPLVNFYNKPPTTQRIADDLSNDELVVYWHTTSGGRMLATDVQELVDFDVHLQHENTIPKWSGEDYFVAMRSEYLGTYLGKKCDKLRQLAAAWIAAEWPDQVKHI